MKPFFRKSWFTNLFQVLNLNFNPCGEVKWGGGGGGRGGGGGIILNRSYISLIIAPQASEFEKILLGNKLLAVNLFQVSHLIFCLYHF